MSVQSNKVDLTLVLRQAEVIRKLREARRRQELTIKTNLADAVVASVYEGRTDHVPTEEVRSALRRVMKAAGFSSQPVFINRWV